MPKKVLALEKDGVTISYCTSPIELRGIGRCNHLAHQNDGETPEEFLKRIDTIINENQRKIENNDSKNDGDSKNKELNPNERVDLRKHREISQKEIDTMAKQLDDICGVHITPDNWKEVFSKLDGDKMHQIVKLGFSAAPEFSLPISDVKYEDENIKNKIYFANLPEYGIAGNKDAIKQMFEKVGNTPTLDGKGYEINHSYEQGLTPKEYFERQLSARDAGINKSVSTAKPGYCIWENSLITLQGGEEIFWKDLQVGNIFEDGSICEEIQDWQMKPCYELKILNHNPIVLSFDHLVSGKIIVNNKEILDLEKSAKARENIGESDPGWICVEDIYDMFIQNATIDICPNTDDTLEYIKKFRNLEPQKVRCISSSTGYYETNGLIHHNTARKLFYCLSETMVADDCGYSGPEEERNALNCLMPEGHICEKCAHATQGGQFIKKGDMIGGYISTGLSEALTQLSMKQKHVGTGQVTGQINASHTIMNTLDGFKTSPIIQKACEAETTKEMREIIFYGLKDLYHDAGIKEDDFNIQMIARKLTSYKRGKDGLEPIQPGEKADIVSMVSLGNKDNIFKKSELSAGYKTLTKPIEQTLKKDAANDILR